MLNRLETIAEYHLYRISQNLLDRSPKYSYNTYWVKDGMLIVDFKYDMEGLSFGICWNPEWGTIEEFMEILEPQLKEIKSV